MTGQLQIRAQPLAGAAECLFAGRRLRLTGTVDGDATITANGPAAELARVARGAFRFTARDGRILKAPAIARILALDVVSSALRARPGDLMASGLDYSEFVVEGTLRGGVAEISTTTLKAAALAIAMAGEIDFPAERVNLRGIVAPFGRIQNVAQHIPIVGQIFGARVVGIPVTVRGDLRDPTVVPLGPAAIGQSLVNLMGAVVGETVDLVDPFLGRSQPAGSTPPVSTADRSARGPRRPRSNPWDARGGRPPCRP